MDLTENTEISESLLEETQRAARNHSNGTLILTHTEIETVLSLRELIDAIGKAYKSFAIHRCTPPKRAVATAGRGSVVINFPGILPGYKFFTVKTNTKTPSNPERGLPFVMGVILMLDYETGKPLAIFESSVITSMRTCAAGAVGVETLARPEARKIASIGAGSQGAWQLRALKSIERLEEAWVYDILPHRAAVFAKNLSAELGIPIRTAASLREVVEKAEIIITATQSREPLITGDLVKPGMHINAFGADEPGKVEIDSEILRRHLVIVDDRRLALSDGTLNVACINGQVGIENIHAEIGEVLAGIHPGRQTPEQVSIFGSVGLAFQDLVACSLVYGKAISQGLGVWVNL